MNRIVSVVTLAGVLMVATPPAVAEPGRSAEVTNGADAHAGKANSSAAAVSDETRGDQGARRPVVAVFGFKFEGMKMSAKQSNLLAEYLRNQLTASGAFVVMPDAVINQAIAQLQRESHQDCRDDACRIELGKAVSANKFISPVIFKVGAKCRILATLYDVQTSASSGAPTMDDYPCTQQGLLEGLDVVAADLAGIKRPERHEPEPPQYQEQSNQQPAASNVQPAARYAQPAAPYVQATRTTGKVMTRVSGVDVRASSEVPSTKGINSPANAIDGKLDTWWGEGAPGDGIGEWLELRWGARVEIREIRLVSGYQKLLRDKYGDRWFLNNRLKQVRVDAGGVSFVTSLEDRKGFQAIVLPEGVFGNSVRVVILDVYPGYNSTGNHIEDSGISEIQVMALQ